LNEETKDRSLARTVFGSTGLIAAAGGLNKLFTLVSAPILTAALGPKPYGVVALLSTLTALATTVALLGVDQSYTRFFFSGVPEEGAAVERFCWRFSLALACVVSFAAGAAWWLWSGRMGLPPSLAILVTAGIFLAVGNSMAVTRQRLRGAYRRIAFSIVAAGGAGAALAIVLALYWRKDAWALLLGSAGGIALGILVAGLPPRETVRRGSGLSRSYRLEILRLGAAGAVTAPMFWLMNSADRWISGMWQGQGPLGVYAFATNVGLVGMMVNSAVTLTWFPEMTRSFEESGGGSQPQIGRLWSRLVAALLVAWLAVTASGGDVIRLLADPQFHEGASYVPWLAGGTFFYGISLLANTGLVLRKDLTPAIAWWVLGAAGNVGLNVVLVPSMGVIGAAVSACLSFGLIASGVMWSAQGRFPLLIPWGRLAAAACLGLGAGIVMSPPWAGSAVLSLCLKFPAGLACGIGIMRIVAPDWVDRLLAGEFTRMPWGDRPPGGE
jgi:O-antigen/teichoic acid export membrane protein